MTFGLAINWVMTRIILGLVFFTLFTLISIVLKILKKDPMNRSIDKNASSYRGIANKQSVKHMDKPF